MGFLYRCSYYFAVLQLTLLGYGLSLTESCDPNGPSHCMKPFLSYQYSLEVTCSLAEGSISCLKAFLDTCSESDSYAASTVREGLQDMGRMFKYCKVTLEGRKVTDQCDVQEVASCILATTLPGVDKLPTVLCRTVSSSLSCLQRLKSTCRGPITILLQDANHYVEGIISTCNAPTVTTQGKPLSSENPLNVNDETTRGTEDTTQTYGKFITTLGYGDTTETKGKDVTTRRTEDTTRINGKDLTTLLTTLENEVSTQTNGKAECTVDNIRRCSAHSMNNVNALFVDQGEYCRKIDSFKSCVLQILPNCDESMRPLLQSSLSQVIENMPITCPLSEKKCTVDNIQRCAADVMPSVNSESFDVDNFCRKLDSLKSCILQILPNCDESMMSTIQYSILQPIEELPIQCPIPEKDPLNGNDETTRRNEDTTQTYGKLMTTLGYGDTTETEGKDVTTRRTEDTTEINGKLMTTLENEVSTQTNGKEKCTIDDLEKCVSHVVNLPSVDVDVYCRSIDSFKSCVLHVLPNCDESMRQLLQSTLSKVIENTPIPCPISEKNQSNDKYVTTPGIEDTTRTEGKDLTSPGYKDTTRTNGEDLTSPGYKDTTRTNGKDLTSPGYIDTTQTNGKDMTTTRKQDNTKCTLANAERCGLNNLMRPYGTFADTCRRIDTFLSCVQPFLPNCNGVHRSEFETIISALNRWYSARKCQKIDKYEVPPQTCTSRNITDCFNQLDGSVDSQDTERFCGALNETEICLHNLNSTCTERGVLSAVEDRLSQLQLNKSICSRSQRENTDCSIEEYVSCLRIVQDSSGTDDCRAIDKRMSCLRSLLPHCRAMMKSHVESAIDLYVVPLEACNGKKSAPPTCSLSDVRDCLSPLDNALDDAANETTICRLSTGSASCLLTLQSNNCTDNLTLSVINDSLPLLQAKRNQCARSQADGNERHDSSSCNKQRIADCVQLTESVHERSIKSAACRTTKMTKGCLQALQDDCTGDMGDSIAHMLTLTGVIGRLSCDSLKSTGGL